MTAPDPEVSSLAGGEWDVSSLFEPRQLRGRQVSWEAVRQALAELGRPSTLVELRETIWRQYSDYITRVGLGEVRRSDKFGSLVEKIVSSSVVGGRVVLARVGPDSQQEEFLWLERAEWPAVREREAWSDYRTVHQASTEISGYFLVISSQAVRCAIQEIIRAGQRYSGVFGQVKLVHEFVGRNTNFSKKQVR